MKFAVAIKQVPLRDSPLRPAVSGAWIDETNLSFEINEPDAYALEEALQLREKHGGEVLVICAGPERAASTLREALAKGADRAIHVQIEALLDSFATAQLLAGALREEAPDLILTGLQSDDLGSGQTGVVLAELLGMPHSTIIMQVEIRDAGLRVKRELEDGWFQHLEIPLPAVLTIQSGLNKLRYATLMGIKKAKSKELRVVSPGAPSAASSMIEKVYAPQKSQQAQVFTGDAKTTAAQLLERLRFEARVL